MSLVPGGVLLSGQEWNKEGNGYGTLIHTPAVHSEEKGLHKGKNSVSSSAGDA